MRFALYFKYYDLKDVVKDALIKFDKIEKMQEIIEFNNLEETRLNIDYLIMHYLETYKKEVNADTIIYMDQLEKLYHYYEIDSYTDEIEEYYDEDINSFCKSVINELLGKTPSMYQL